jgi:vanillate O-demethylase monooxygenase subunit
MPAGTDIAAAKQRRILNFITPETATSSHYFWGVARLWELGNTALSDGIRADVIKTFDQDKVLLEAQQRVLDSDPSLQAFPVTIKIDAGPILGRRLLESKLAESRLVPAGSA